MPGIAQAPETSLPEALATITVLNDLPGDQIDWLANRVQDLRFDDGAIIVREGEPAYWMFFVLDGRIRIQRESAGPDAPAFEISAGEVSGLLPYSRMTHSNSTVRAVQPVRLARLAKTEFQAMIEKMPVLSTRLVGIMADRIRESTKCEQQRDKLITLGKLSAGLAHEINNPAAAVSRAASHLDASLTALSEASIRLESRPLDPIGRLSILDLEKALTGLLGNTQHFSAVELSDREEEIGCWFEREGIARAWEHARVFAESGADLQQLRCLLAQSDQGVRSDLLERTTANFTAKTLVAEIRHGISRITDLVCAMKEYSYMDQAPEQEIDIHEGIESSLRIIAHKLRENCVDITCEFDRSLPRIWAFGRELNQVWMNLIDNAADAMSGGGRLCISTSFVGQQILVDLQDTGPGIPVELQQRIFEPFFTTKPIGKGTGLGLDTVAGIVSKHRGKVQVQSQPGETHFRVYVPVERARQLTGL